MNTKDQMTDIDRMAAVRPEAPLLTAAEATMIRARLTRANARGADAAGVERSIRNEVATAVAAMTPETIAAQAEYFANLASLTPLAPGYAAREHFRAALWAAAAA